MNAEEIAQLLTAGMQPQGNGNTDVGYHVGTVLSWDELTGVNSVRIQGNTFDNLRVLSTSNSVMLSTGDTVVVMRIQTQYFILGRVQAPGQSAALRIAAADVDAVELLPPGSSAFTDLATIGPTVSNVYIGSARRCLVFMSANVSVDSLSAYASFAVSGASTITPTAASDRRTMTFGLTSTSGSSTVTKVVLVNATDGLNQGLNTFTMKYRCTAGVSCGYFSRKLVVFPY